MSGPGAGPTSDRLFGLQLARGVAALLVFLFHFDNGMSWIVGYAPFRGCFAFGRAGVDFFFALSGFVIFWVHDADIGQPTGLPRYIIRRLARVYPTYWLATTIIILLRLPADPAFASSNPGWVIRSLLLLPQGRPPIVEIGWSLQHEMMFYALFAVLIAHRRSGQLLFATWLLAIGVSCWVSPAGVEPMNLTSPFDLAFFLGLGAGYIVKRWRPGRPISIAVAGLAIFLLVGAMEMKNIVSATDLAGRILYGGASVLIIVGIVRAEQQGWLKLGRWADWLGGLSYALYLFHIISIAILQAVFVAAGADAFLPGWLIVIGSFGATLAVASVIHTSFERPVVAWINYRFAGRVGARGTAS